MFQPAIIRTVRAGATISIGDDVGISGATVSASKSIAIGNGVLIGSGSLITDSDAHALNPEDRRKGKDGVAKPIIIGNDVFIGARAIILKGVTIGEGAVVGAGAVVAHDVPPRTIVAGNPARIVGRVP